MNINKQDDLKREQKRKFFEEISFKKARIKKEFNLLRSAAHDPVPRYDLRTNEIIRKSPRSTVIDDKSGRGDDSVAVSTPRLPVHNNQFGSKNGKIYTWINFYFIVVNTLINTTISALSIYKNHLPSPRRTHLISLPKKD